MKLRYDIWDMTITQFLEFVLMFLIFVPIQLVLILISYIGSMANELNLSIIVFAHSLGKRIGLPLLPKEDEE